MGLGGAVASAVSLSTDQVAKLQKDGFVKIGERVLSLKYFGNQYDPADMIAAAKNKQLMFVQFNRFATTSGYALSGIMIGMNTYQYANDSISSGRYAYNLSGGLASIGLSLAGRTTVGALVGLGFTAGSLYYDQFLSPVYGSIPYWNTRLENAIKQTAINKTLEY